MVLPLLFLSQRNFRTVLLYLIFIGILQSSILRVKKLQKSLAEINQELLLALRPKTEKLLSILLRARCNQAMIKIVANRIYEVLSQKRDPKLTTMVDALP